MSPLNSGELNKKIQFPPLCDYLCKYADFSNPNSISACMKELAVWYKLERYNNKNNKWLGIK